MTQRIGAYNMYSITGGTSALVTLVIPVAAKHASWQGVCVCRAATGLCQGAILSLLINLLSKWAPTSERTSMGQYQKSYAKLCEISFNFFLSASFVFAGGWIGNVISLSLSGEIAASRFGWPGCFYFWGGVMAFWTMLWVVYGKESPKHHPRISPEERKYIELSLGSTETENVHGSLMSR